MALVSNTWTGSEPLFWQRLREELRAQGTTTEVIAADVPTTLGNRRDRGRHRTFLLVIAFIRAVLQSPARTLLCIEYGVPTALSTLIGRLRGRRVIIFQEHRWPPLSTRNRAYRRAVISLAHAVIANTDDAYLQLSNDLHVDRGKLFRATILVPPDRASLTLHGQEPTPEPRWRPVFLFVGRLVAVKNVEGLIDAAIRLRARGLTFEVWIAGDGELRNELEDQAEAPVAEGVVRFLGSIHPQGVGQLYAAADCFVMPSLREYRSVAVLEALRFGTPVIDSARDGNAGDLVIHEVTGLVFDPTEPESLERAMSRMIREPEMRREMGVRAAAAMAGHTPQGAADALCEILDAVEAR